MMNHKSTAFSDYLIFVDESGDHGLSSIDPNFPLFALVFVLVKKSDYLEKIVPSFQSLKMKYWGHDQIILHAHDIRKTKGCFGMLRSDPSLRDAFMEDLTNIIEEAPFYYIASIIHKGELIRKYSSPFNPYEIGLLFCMERTLDLLLDNKQESKTAHIHIEGRGKKEDEDLNLEFLRICANKRNWGYKAPDFQKISFDMIYVDKKSNSPGLQLPDLIVRPIALKGLYPSQVNRTHKTLLTKNKGEKYFP